METIVAIATPPGRGGVGIVRMSGPLSGVIAKKLTKTSVLTPRKALYRSFFSASNDLIDEGLLLYFNAPHSFTGEEVVECQLHGSPVVLDIIMSECVLLGARLARPGEFSERAFLNDKLDLVQAEAIADLIDASSKTAARMAVRSLQGDFSKKIQALNQQLIQLRLHVEAAIDFPEEEIDFLSDGVVFSQLTAIRETLASIRANAHQGVVLREGLSVVIAGHPNAGKSTLMNQLSGQDVAIVTPIAGTTRDVMRSHILLDDIPLTMIDTAGLRDSDDAIEQEGIKRAWQEISRADCVLLITDASVESNPYVLKDAITAALPVDVPIISVFNKMDLCERSVKLVQTSNVVPISAKSGDGLELLTETIKKVVGYQPVEGSFLARRRHLQALDAAASLLSIGQTQLLEHRAGELLAEDLRAAHRALSEITGELSADELLGKIFSNFCIGK